MKNNADPDPGGCDPRSRAVIPDPTPFLALDPLSHIPRYDPDEICMWNSSLVIKAMQEGSIGADTVNSIALNGSLHYQYGD